ncbi:hypothetical protein [Massilia sp. TWR1-2-2]|uniref:hypothetical protein n=1 Tax=Massilia sp. TWR1-2-2 TaxID=2804584 RepID=UPI003CFB9127
MESVENTCLYSATLEAERLARTGVAMQVKSGNAAQEKNVYVLTGFDREMLSVKGLQVLKAVFAHAYSNINVTTHIVALNEFCAMVLIHRLSGHEAFRLLVEVQQVIFYREKTYIDLPADSDLNEYTSCAMLDRIEADNFHVAFGVNKCLLSKSVFSSVSALSPLHG